ncbi:hypothetical protein [Actinacidiphila rubida]|uniref:HEAT repeat protein n=1 Tax=Actinacidiphila rubida TaxID=310780 RepID=A0A1H8JJ45_9ACTN|nr:hypothetical protein [Actinacidiphila rubida]SEN80571.1 hypothetical protein SAMN05216267_1010140 [Actinacidiphila rubida]
MSDEVGAVRAALGEASSRSWRRRARAGCRLAPSAEDPAAAEALSGLLLDGADTAVSRRTAAALTRTGTAAAVRLIAVAVARADDGHADWIQTGVQDALAARDGKPDVVAACGQLAGHPDAAVREGAAQILAWAAKAGR